MAGTTAQRLTLEAARRELGLRREEFTLGIEHGVIRTCWSGGELCVRAGEVARWRAAPGELAELTRLVHATEAAGLAGMSRHRFDQLARAGAIQPVRSYTNRYHAEVWQYSAADARQLPECRPELLRARLPGPCLAELASGADRRAEGHRSRLRAQALLMLRDPWTKAAAWSYWLCSAQPPVDRVQLGQAEAVHLARRAAEERLTEVLGSHANPVTSEEQAEAARQFKAALRRARRSRPAPELVAPSDAAARLGCAVEQIPDEYRDRGVPADLLEQSVTDGLATVPAPARVAAVRKQRDAQRRKDERQAAREAELAAKRRLEGREHAAAARARAHIPERTADPRVTFHLGPTNSGKTHDAIALLAARAEAGRTGVYAAPLRMLAFEVYERLRTRLGADLVGLHTGEERLNPDAPVLCCTAEVAPTTGDFLVVDEAHWLADEDRGHAWTRLLLSGAHTDVHVCAAPEAEDLLRKFFAPGTDITVVRHTRHGKLSRTREFQAATLPPASAVVAFSRKAVLALHRELLEAGRSATVLYGAMPPAARREQIRRLSEGEVDVIVTTDVIGHGVNLPLRTVAFAETGKYDGRSRRELLIWEAAQIAGRAGRRGHDAGEGLVSAYRSRLPGLAATARLLDRAVQAANGARSGDLRVTTARLRPTWIDLGRPEPGEIPHALAGWAAAARKAAQERSWLRPMPTAEILGKLQAARQAVGASLDLDARRPREGHTVWRLITLPIDADRPAYPAVCRAVLHGAALHHLIRPRARIERMALPQAEEYAATMRDVGTAVLAFGRECGGLSAEEVAACEQTAAERINQLVAASRPLATYGSCVSCDGSCAPWHTHCDACHTARFSCYDVEFDW
jgi:ATP-dependent RNA helicase SUPV3L1/SUV3